MTRAWQLILSFCFLRLDTSVIYERVPGKDNMLRGDRELSWRPMTKYLSSCFCWLQLILLFILNLFIFLYLRISYLCTMKCIHINLCFLSNFINYCPQIAFPNSMSFSIFDYSLNPISAGCTCMTVGPFTNAWDSF